MNNEYQFTASELIHLFVDGEAEPTQQALLFSLLATDTGLQEQFRAAVFMQQTLEQVRASAVPPAHYTTELFSRAGFTSATGTAAVAPSFWSGIPPAAKSIILSLCSAAMGAGLAILLMLPSLQDITGQTSSTASVALPDTTRYQQGLSSGHSQAHVPGPGPVEQNAAVGGTDRTEARYRSTSDRDGAPATELQTTRQQTLATSEEVRSQQSSTLADNATSNRYRNSTLNGTRNSTQSASLTPTEPATSNPATESLENTPEQQEENSTRDMQPITAVSLTSLGQQQVGTLGRNKPQLIELSDIPPAEEIPGVVVYLKNTQALSWYPMRDIPASTMDENLMFGGLYYLSAEHAVGAEVGRELLPLYSFVGDLQIRNSTLLWGGAIYQYQPSALMIGNTMEPFVRLGLGGTGAGPMGKLMLGMRLQTSNVLSASIGLEGTTLVYRRHTTIETTGKLGFTVSIEAGF